MSTPSPTVLVEQVSVTYNNGHLALHDVSFTLEPGTITALIGVNGSGKSTLFKTLMGQVTPATGRILVSGEPIARARRANRVAYVPQTDEVDWTFPIGVAEVVMTGRYGYMNFLRTAHAEDRRIVAESLRRVGMWEYRERQIGELSGGQKKRVFLARALAQQARLILLDEPFTGVDVETEAAIIALMRELRDAGAIILVSTHNLASVPEYCDRVVMINRTLVCSGAVSDTYTEANLDKAFGSTLRRVTGVPSHRAQG